MTDGYLLANRQSEAGKRLRALAELFDPSTFRHIERIGIARGWHCWEVGAGGPTVAAWLAERGGVEGSVLATAIDLSWITGPGQRSLAGRRRRGPRPRGLRPRPPTGRGGLRVDRGAPARRLAPGGGRRPGTPTAGLPGRVRGRAAPGQQDPPGRAHAHGPTGRGPRLRTNAAPSAPPRRAGRGRGRRLLPDHLPVLHGVGARYRGADSRSTRHRGDRHGRGDRAVPGCSGLGRAGCQIGR